MSNYETGVTDSFDYSIDLDSPPKLVIFAIPQIRHAVMVKLPNNIEYNIRFKITKRGKVRGVTILSRKPIYYRRMNYIERYVVRVISHYQFTVPRVKDIPTSVIVVTKYALTHNNR